MIWGCAVFVLFCTASVAYCTVSVGFCTVSVTNCTACVRLFPVEVFIDAQAIKMADELQGDAHVPVDVPSRTVHDPPSAASLFAVVLDEAQVFEYIDVPDHG